MEEKKRLQPTEGGRCVECMHPAASGEPPTEALVDAIPVADILQRLLALPTEKAWEVFGGLDRLLKSHPVWRKHDVSIHEAQEEKLRQRAMQYASQFTNELYRKANVTDNRYLFF